MSQLIQALVLGLLIGGVYALMASGLTLIFGVMRIINIAQGAFLVLVAMLTWWLWRETGIDPILASVVTTPLMFGFGWLLYRLVISRIRDQSPSMSVLLTFGFALVVEGVLNVVAGNTRPVVTVTDPPAGAFVGQGEKVIAFNTRKHKAFPETKFAARERRFKNACNRRMSAR